MKLSLSLKDGRTIYQQGEIIPLVMSFTSTAKRRYWADVRNYDRSGRLGIETYCVEPEVPDPLESYFGSIAGFLGGGLGGQQQLSEKPFLANAELNEWRSPGPGHYSLYVISGGRVWRPPDPGEKTPWGRLGVVVRSNTVHFDVVAASPEWQEQQLRDALQSLDSPDRDVAKHAARVLRFLGTRASTEALARKFWALNQQPNGWDLMFGLFGSPNRQLAISTMQQEFAAPDHAITDDFLSALVRLEISSDAAWNPPKPTSQEQVRAFWNAHEKHEQELMGEAIKAAVAALPDKTGKVRALTVAGILTAGANDPALVSKLKPALIASWPELPADIRDNLLQYRWQLIAGPDMLPILRQIADEPPPLPRTMHALTRDAALRHIYELDPELGRSLILRDLLDSKFQPGMDLVRLLPHEDLEKAIPPAVKRIVRGEWRIPDYALLDEYADATYLEQIKSDFEPKVGNWACDPQTHMLRYFLRVAPAYGAKEVAASLKSRKLTGCYRSLLQDLGDELPAAESIAIGALNDPDPEVAEDAALALGRWGRPDGEAALWACMKKFHRQWKGRESELRSVPPYNDAGSRALGLQGNLISALCAATNWICTPRKLKRLERLAVTGHEKEEIQGWTKLWNKGSALIQPSWFPADHVTFSVLQYQALTENQLKAKVAQFPRGTHMRFQFWQPGQIAPPVTMARQEAVYLEIQAVAQQHGIELAKTN